MANQAFREKLVDICSRIGTDDLEKLKFVLKDVTGGAKLESANIALDLFSALEHKRNSAFRDGRFLAECFILIGRRDLIKHLGLNANVIEEEIENSSELPPFRIMLYRISEDLSEDEYERLKYFCNNECRFKRSQLEKIKSVFDLFVLLEKGDFISPVKICLLKRAMEAIERGDLLIELIKKYQKKNTCMDGEEDSVLQNTASALPPEPEPYKMTAKPRGLCIIINNKSFAGVVFKEKPERKGSDVDAAKLEETFSKLGFKTQRFDNCTELQMYEIMNLEARSDHSKFDALVVCILSHGDNNTVYSVDEKQVQLTSLTKPFHSSNCASLRGKPKLVFLQACQGTQTQTGIRDIEHDGPTVVEPPCYSQELLAGVQADAQVVGADKGKVIADHSDFLVSFATVPGFLSYRDTSKGSFYIQSLTRNLDKYAGSKELTSILKIVSNEVSEHNIPDKDEKEKIYKQVPMQQCTLRKDLFLNPQNLK